MIARVLLIDDDECVRRALASSLQRAGFVVETAEDGAPAFRMAETMTFDLIVVDYHMATSTGPDVVRHFKGLYGAQIYCAVLSGEDDEEKRAACRAAGADDVFVKPASTIWLRERLTAAARALRGQAA